MILIKGAVPGTEGAFVKIRDAVKTAAPKDLPLPGAFKGGAEARRGAAAEAARLKKARGRSMKIDVIKLNGDKGGALDLPDDIFGIDRHSRRHPAALRDLAARQAPRRHAQGPDAQRSLAHR